MTIGSRPVSPAPRRTKTQLLTLLGAIVVPDGVSLWQETLVRALGVLGSSVPAARQAVARGVGDGWLTSERVGRRARMTVSEELAIQLRDGLARADAFGRPQVWRGEWLIVALTVPEASRALRHRYRSELGWLGFGSLGNGLWVSPHPENEPEIRRLLRDAQGPGGAFVFTSARPTSHTPEQIAEAAWDMSGLRERYLDFISRFDRVEPATPEERFASWVELQTSWRHFPLSDPELPESLLPVDWPRKDAYRLFHDRTERWRDDAFDYFRGLEIEVLSA